MNRTHKLIFLAIIATAIAIPAIMNGTSNAYSPVSKEETTPHDPKSLTPQELAVQQPDTTNEPLPKVLPQALPQAASPNTRRHIQVVFALDATGSMAGLISAAKEKIWSIANSMTQSDDDIQLEVGLVFYRDRGDEFITKRVAFSENMDDVYAQLMDMDAAGGGDGPESVNQALYEAITKFAWTSDERTYRTVFLVGDFPPHMDYPNDITYKQSCPLATQKDIVLNTILMGDNATARRIWKEIAACNQGSFLQADMQVNDIAISTPYDDSIAAISDQLDEMRYYYGSRQDKVAAYDKMEKSRKIAKYSASNVKAQRMEFNASKSGATGYYGSKELLNDVGSSKAKLSEIKDEDLPENVKAIPAGEREAWVNTKIRERTVLKSKLNSITMRRQEYITKELEKRDQKKVQGSFNNMVFEQVKTESSKKSIELKGKAK